jgi:hypothetical protein
VSKEEICDQIHSAIIQVASGEAASMEDFPDIAVVGSINLLEFEKQF